MLILGPLLVGAVVLVWASPGSWPFRGAITALLVVAAAVMVVKPELLQALPLKSLKLPGGFELELRDLQPIEEETDERHPSHSDSLTDRWLGVRWKIERKLAYLAKHTLPDHLPLINPKSGTRGDTRSFANIGSLVEDGWLGEDEARVLTYAIALSPIDLKTVDETDLEELLAAAERVAQVMRARVFQKFVGKYISTQDGWQVTERAGLRWTVRSGQTQFVVVPVFGTRGGDLVEAQVHRLREYSIEHAIVVVPCYPGTAGRPLRGGPGPHVVRLDQLSELVSTLAPPVP